MSGEGFTSDMRMKHRIPSQALGPCWCLTPTHRLLVQAVTREGPQEHGQPESDPQSNVGGTFRIPGGTKDKGLVIPSRETRCNEKTIIFPQKNTYTAVS